MIPDRTALSDRAVSYLRTIVPILWGTIVAQVLAWLSPHLPTDIGATLAAWLGGETAIALVTALAIAAWYWAWRRLEPHVPDWLVRVVLGSARTPAYALPAAVVELADGTTVSQTLPLLTDADRQALIEVRALLADTGTDDPGVAALDRVLRL